MEGAGVARWTRKVEADARMMHSLHGGDLVNSNVYAKNEKKNALRHYVDAHAHEGNLTPRRDDDTTHVLNKPQRAKYSNERHQKKKVNNGDVDIGNSGEMQYDGGVVLVD